ncbi:hypothetical protein ACUSIJ_09025 [Pseudochelatococcus sp. B33]
MSFCLVIWPLSLAFLLVTVALLIRSGWRSRRQERHEAAAT